MDPVSSKAFRELVRELRGEGRTILLTTHDMAEAEALCDRVGLIDHGRMLAIEPPRVLGKWLDEYERIDIDDAPDTVLAGVAGLPGVVGITAQPDGSTRIQVQGGASGSVLERLVAGGVTSIRTSTPSLEEVYVAVFGERGMRV
jgi:ABC-2 type transport system ATP-binding protein